MFIKDIFDFFLTKLTLEHVVDGKEFRVFDECQNLIKFGRVEDSVGLDDGDGVREVLLFGVEEEWLLLELWLSGGHERMKGCKWLVVNKEWISYKFIIIVALSEWMNRKLLQLILNWTEFNV